MRSRGMGSWSWLAAAGVLACLGAGAAQPSATSDAARRNVLLVTLDTTRADHLGCYGSRVATSPRLDALAAEGVVFEHAIAQAAVTPVSHASILTGLEPYHHGLRMLHGREANRLPDDVSTLATVWRSGGGVAAAFVSAYPASSAFGLARGFDPFDETFPAEASVSADGTVNTGRSQRRADATTDAALRWLRGATTAKRPWLLWVHYFDPHDELLLPPTDFPCPAPPASGRPDAIRRAVYDCEVRFMDLQLGRLLDGVAAAGAADRTVVAVVGDHGEGLGDHGWWSHGVLYQEQIRVPMMVRAPGLPAGARVHARVATTDLAPTLLDLAGVPRAEWPSTDGASLAPALRAGREPEPHAVYADSVNLMTYAWPGSDRRDHKDDRLYALLDGRWKLILHQLKPAESELYDLDADPAELRNVAAEHRDVMKRMVKELAARHPFYEGGGEGTAAERMEKLRSLGYF